MGYEDEPIQEAYREGDRFSRLMLGERKYRKIYQEDESHSEEFPKRKEQSFFRNRRNLKDDWLWGPRRKQPAAKTHFTPKNIESFLENVDLELLMETVDMFVTTAKQYKPFINEIRPFFQRFSKKFKSGE